MRHYVPERVSSSPGTDPCPYSSFLLPAKGKQEVMVQGRFCHVMTTSVEITAEIVA